MALGAVRIISACGCAAASMLMLGSLPGENLRQWVGPSLVQVDKASRNAPLTLSDATWIALAVSTAGLLIAVSQAFLGWRRARRMSALLGTLVLALVCLVLTLGWIIHLRRWAYGIGVN